jgi:alkylation response protein AidB-like acyl-CoA dehydrogenase
MFRLSEEAQELRSTARQFAEEEIRPVAREYEERGEHPDDIVEKAGDNGFATPNIPEKYGGPGHDKLSSVIIAEELCRADTAIGLVIIGAGYGSEMLLDYGEEWMREEWFPQLAAGEIVSATAVSEPSHGSDPAGMETTAELDGDEWVINGEKKWISNGTVADVAVVMAKTDPGGGYAGISAFLVPTATDGFSGEQIDNMMALDVADTARLHLDNVRIPKENLIGEKNNGFYQLMEFFGDSRTSSAAFSLGGAQGALETATSYAQEREQSGQPISEFQAIRHKIADMVKDVEVSRNMTYRAAEAVERRTEDSAYLASMAKVETSETAERVASEAIQIHGGNGLTRDYLAEKFYRDVRASQVWEGTSEIQRNVIADNFL